MITKWRIAALAAGFLALAIVHGIGVRAAPPAADPAGRPPLLISVAAADAADVAGRIAAGDAYDKHVVAERQFPGIASRAAFAALIQAIIEQPAASRRLSNDRTAYWDEASGAVVIANPHDRDAGTCFKPRAGRAYFDNLH
jgi:filamentous hemagglutinin